MERINSEKGNFSSKYFPKCEAKIIVIGSEESETSYICKVVKKVAPMNEVFTVTASCGENICDVFHEDKVLVYCVKIARMQDIQAVADDRDRVNLPVLICLFGENISIFDNTHMLAEGNLHMEYPIIICFDTCGDELSVLASELKLKHIILRKLWL